MEFNENENSRDELEKKIQMEANQLKDYTNPVSPQSSSEPLIKSLVNDDMPNGKNFQKDDFPPTWCCHVMRIMSL